MKLHIANATLVIALFGTSTQIQAQDPEPPVEGEIPGSLKDTPVPLPEDLGDFVRDMDAAIVLGKALFWEMRAGSDGVVACATCHFHAGTDARSINTLNPGTNGTFDTTRSGGAGGPNYDLVAEDWPFHELADPLDRNSDVIFDFDDRVGSQGVHKSDFVQTFRHNLIDLCTPVLDLVNNIDGINTRRQTGRQTPTVINAVFNLRSFWDGRANKQFNGVDPFGPRSPAKVWKVNGDGVDEETVRLKPASLASQAVGPPLSDVEMSCAGRSFVDLGLKMIDNRPLRFQEVHVQDSVLAKYRHWSGLGIRKKYSFWIAKAFQPEWWDYAGDLDGYSLMEANFSLFWGIAIMAYESTLVSDNAKWDRVAEGRASFTEQEELGKSVFFDKGACANCHGGAEFTKATVSHIEGDSGADADDQHVEGMLMNDRISPAVYDNGFYNIGARPTFEDLGVGGEDPWGNPLSHSRQAKSGNIIDDFILNPANFEEPVDVNPDTRDAVDGSFKTPSLRNIELTGPYMHHGGLLTLEQVVEFYNRGGDVRGPIGNDTSGHGDNLSNLDPDITSLELTDEEQEALVAFLKTLTDRRVKYQSGPFDHPQLFISNGHNGNENWVEPTMIPIFASDDIREIPASGRYGFDSPLRPFLQQRLIQVPESERGPALIQTFAADGLSVAPRGVARGSTTPTSDSTTAAGDDSDSESETGSGNGDSTEAPIQR